MQREVVVLLQPVDGVVALVAQDFVQVGDLDERLPFDLCVGERHRHLSDVSARERVLDAIRAIRHPNRDVGVLGLDDRHRLLEDPEVPLIGRLVIPDPLHVVEDVLLHVDAQPIDLGDAVVVLLDRGRQLVDRNLQRRGRCCQLIE